MAYGNTSYGSKKNSSPKKPKKAVKKVSVAKGVKMTKKAVAAARKKPGGSNVGKYKSVSKKDFAGAAGGAPKLSYPDNSMERAKSALKLAHNAPNPAGIINKVYAKYPSLKKKK